MYLEGSDQHRGWFHSSLLCAVGTRGHAPYKAVLTHGYTVDAEGKKYSKSSGNYIPLDDLLKDYGAEVLRMWTASENFRNDIRVSKEILDGISQVYRKVRNTLRYMLGNLADFDPNQDALPVADLLPLDRWMLGRVEQFKRRAIEAYAQSGFHFIYHGLNALCTVDLSALYFDLVRDRLYCEAPASRERRSAQTAIQLALDALIRLMAPVLAFTAEEVFDHLPGRDRAVKSVHCLNFPAAESAWLDEELAARMERVFKFQEEVNKVLDQGQKNKVIGHPNDAKLTLSAAPDDLAFLRALDGKSLGGEDLARLFKVSGLVLSDTAPDGAVAATEVPGLAIKLEKAPGGKCERCWFYRTDLGHDAKHPQICGRCAEVVNKLAGS